MTIDPVFVLGCSPIMKAEMATTASSTGWTTTSDETLSDLGLLGSDSGSVPDRTWPQVIDHMLTIRGLADAWDGQGAEAPAQDLVGGAIALAENIAASGLRPADLAVAGVNGTVIFEWHDPAGYLELEVVAADRAEGRWLAKGSDAARTFILSR
jgi:hypothetical protein